MSKVNGLLAGDRIEALRILAEAENVKLFEVKQTGTVLESQVVREQ